MSENHITPARMRFIYSIVASFILLQSTCGTECPTNFLQLHNKCYFFSTQRASWRDAHFLCAQHNNNSELLMLRSKHNNRQLTKYLLRDHLNPKEWWIDASYDWRQKSWHWGATGKPVKFHRFVASINRAKLDWKCAFLDERYEYQWNAAECSRKKYYICMIHADVADDAQLDKDNEIPLIVSRDALEENHTKNASNNNNNGNDIQASFLRPKGQQRRGKYRRVCPKGYGQVRNACYKFSRTKGTWQDAFFQCSAEPNGSLAIIPDKKYDRGIRWFAKRVGATIHERWISGIYDWKKAAWKWAANGHIIQHQENHKDLLAWHCLVWSPLITDKWTSDVCLNKKHYICQTSPRIIVAMGRQSPGSRGGVRNCRTSTTLEFRQNGTHRHEFFAYNKC